MKQSVMVTNPLISNRADPWVYKHTDGYYYFTATEPEYNYIELRRSETLLGIRTAEPKVIWRKHSEGKMSCNIWAPEIHFIDGKWYIYFAAAWTSDTIDGLFDHRMFVLENGSSNPIEGTWIEKGQIKTGWESFALDATTFEHKGIRYLVWAQKDPAVKGNSNIYIAAMSNPWSIQGIQVRLTVPEYDWECIGFLVNEGPAVLKRNGHIFISYSASATDHNYCMGLLMAKDTDDLLNPNSWIKSPSPVFKSNGEASVYGPGHNSFTVSEDGKEDIIIYHARKYKEIEGFELDDPNRHTCLQRISWNIDGTPNFGIPVTVY
jgi:GH43 family beta-xylosidase